MVNLTSRLCWNLVKKEGYIAIWQKPSDNSCYLSREAGTQPPLCDSEDDPDNVWYYLLSYFSFPAFDSSSPGAKFTFRFRSTIVSCLVIGIRN